MLYTSKITDNIIRVSADTQFELSNKFLRFQEHYESPFWRDKIFTIGQFRAWYSETYSSNTYENDWAGFNFPSYVFNSFIQGLFDPLTLGEQELLDLFRYRTDKYYVIGAQSADILDHEECHALFHVNDAYRKKVLNLLDKHEKDTASIKDWLINENGYHHSVIMDEVHAYTSASRDLFEIHNISFPEELHKKLRKLKSQYMKDAE